MAAVEREAQRLGRWLLVLDTVPGESGYRLYKRAGWTQSGIIPDYAQFPDGRLCDTAVFWKRLTPSDDRHPDKASNASVMREQ